MANVRVNQATGDIAIQRDGGYAIYEPGQYKYNAKNNQYAVKVDGGWEIHDAGPVKPLDLDALLHLSPGTVAREGVEQDRIYEDKRTPLNVLGEKIKGFGREAFNTLTLGGGDEIKALLDTAKSLPDMGPATSPYDELSKNIDVQSRARSEFEITDPNIARAAKIGGTVLNPLNLVGGEFIAGARGLVPAMGRGAAVGGAFGATSGALSTDGGIQDRAMGAATGASIGAGVGGALPLVGAALAPKVSPEVQLLLSKGIKPTPGQIIGGAANRFEEKLTSIPIVGDVIAAGRRKAQEQFNTAVANDALAPIGKTTSATPGRDLVADVKKQISDEYTRILKNVTFVEDAQLTADVSALRTQATKLGGREAARFDSILEDIGRKISNGTMSGEQFKIVEGELSEIASRYGKAQDPYQNELGDLVGDLLDAMRASLPRTNPMHATPLQNANQAWAKFKRIQRAAGYVGGKDGEPGVFSSDQFQSAVKAMDRSKDKGAFAAGRAVMQDVSDAAKSVLGSKVPDSGTPTRVAAMLAGTGGLAAIEPTTLAATGALTLPYLPVTGDLTRWALTHQGPVADLLRNAFLKSIQAGGNVSGQIGGAIAAPQGAR